MDQHLTSHFVRVLKVVPLLYVIIRLYVLGHIAMGILIRFIFKENMFYGRNLTRSLKLPFINLSVYLGISLFFGLPRVSLILLANTLIGASLFIFIQNI